MKRPRSRRSGRIWRTSGADSLRGFATEIETNPARKPDLGEARVHPTAGATVVGARKALIAYNVFLNTTDVDIAKKIAKAVRFSSGGLRYVKGAGFPVRGQAQVSMNLTDFEQTPIARVFEFVKREAARYGVMPYRSEIVGLIPKKALEDAAEWFLQVENFDSSLILENRLSAVMSGKMAVGRIASRSRALHRATGRANVDTRRRKRFGSGGGNGGWIGEHGCGDVTRQESLRAVRIATERSDCAAECTARRAEGRNRGRCRGVQRCDEGLQGGEGRG